MKKYEKPTIAIERFELSHSIANCNPAMNHAEGACKYESNELFGKLNPGETVFNLGDCTYSMQEFVSIFEGYCLQTSADSQTLFTS